MSKAWEALADSIMSTIKSRAKEFLDENSEAKTFLAERARSFAKLAIDYKLETDEEKKKAILHEMELDKNAIELQLDALALKGKEASKTAFREIVGTAFGALIKYLPAVLSAL